MKRILYCLLSILLLCLRSYAQTLCIIDGSPVPDSILQASIKEMQSDSARQIVAQRIGNISPYAISSVQTISKECIASKSICCNPPSDIIVIQTNRFAQFDWIVDGKLMKPSKDITIVDYKLSPQILSDALPRKVKRCGIASIKVMLYRNNPRPEARPTVIIETKKKKTRR